MLSFLMIIDTPEEQSAFIKLYNSYNKDAYRAAMSILKEHHLALDAVQIAFTNIAKKFYLVQAVDEVAKRRYVCETAKNCAKNILRKEQRTLSMNEYLDETIPDEDILMESRVIEIDDCERLMNKLNEINPSYREILVLRHYGELSYKEIADLLGIKLVTAKVRGSRALAALRMIAEEEVDCYE